MNVVRVLDPLLPTQTLHPEHLTTRSVVGNVRRAPERAPGATGRAQKLGPELRPSLVLLPVQTERLAADDSSRYVLPMQHVLPMQQENRGHEPGETRIGS